MGVSPNRLKQTRGVAVCESQGRSSHGFTLIKLPVVIAIIAILASLCNGFGQPVITMNPKSIGERGGERDLQRVRHWWR